MERLSDVGTVERVCCSRLCRECATDVLPVLDVASGVPHKRVHVTVLVHVHECRSGVRSERSDICKRRNECVGPAFSVTTKILQVLNLALLVPHKQIQFVVPIKVHERWVGVVSDIITVERVPVICVLHEGTTVVLPVPNLAVSVANKQIQVTVGVHIHERRSRVIADVLTEVDIVHRV